MLNMTEAARKKFHEVTTAEGRSGQGLRVMVRNGHSPQPEFALNFVEPDSDLEGDVICEVDGIRVHMDPDSAPFLEGATIDFVDELTQSGFKVDAPNAGVRLPTGPIAEAMQRVLEEKINPSVASHGGHVSLVAIEDETAYLKFGGGCQGCGMVNVTLKQGVEKVVFDEVPAIKKIMDVTDHASGTNPYYEPAK